MKMFKPMLNVRLDLGLKNYTVEACVPVPNSCYIAAGVVRGLPSGVVLAAPAEPVQLVIEKNRGVCVRATKLLEYSRRGFPVMAAIDQVIAFSVHHNQVLGVSTTPIPRLNAASFAGLVLPHKVKPSGARLQTVDGWIDEMPGSARDMHVIATMWAPSTGYKFSLKKVGPYGTTGRTLLLKMKAKAPKVGDSAETVSEVRFNRTLKKGEDYDSVAVQFENDVLFAALEVIR